MIYFQGCFSRYTKNEGEIRTPDDPNAQKGVDFMEVYLSFLVSSQKKVIGGTIVYK